MLPQEQPAAPFNGAAIPQYLKNLPHWTVWRAVWNPKRNKYDKVPYRADMPDYGISTARPDTWYPYEQALECFNAVPGRFTGLGLCMTGLKGLVGIDLDGCIGPDGTLAEWAAGVVQSAGSYTEISPSGAGLRIFLRGDQPDDWNNHDLGMEVYGGHDARFLTITGNHYPGTPEDVQPAHGTVLADLESRHAKVRTRASIIDLQMPDLLPEAALPDISTLEIQPQVLAFLESGAFTHDRSSMLHTTGIALYAAGLDDAQVFSTLVHNEYCMEVALDHRRQDSERAQLYLWREQCLKTKPKAAARVAPVSDFEDISREGGSGAPPVAPARKKRFQFQQAAEYITRKPVAWLVHNVLPRAEVGAIFGESGAGKSFLTLDLVAAIATGTEWMGRRVKQGTVAYICAEGAGGFSTRLQAYAEHYLTDLSAIPLHILGDAPNFLLVPDIRDLVASIKALGDVSVIVVDTLAQVTAGANENSGEDMGRALANCKALAAATGAMVLLVAHSGKDSSRGLRGWSGIKGALDVEILVEQAGEYRAATVTKMKDGRGEGDEFPFTLSTVVLRQDEAGDDVSSCIVQAGKVIPKERRTGKVKGPHQQVVLRVATTTGDLSGPPTEAELINLAVAEMPLDEAKEDRRRDNVVRALTSLVAANRLSIQGGRVVVV